MTTIDIRGSDLMITVDGMDKLWALMSRVTLPLSHIARVSYDPEIAKGWYHGLKFPGTNIPGVITAGTFYRDGEWAFWDVHDPERAIIIELKDEKYQKLIVEVPDPDAAIAQIQSALNEANRG